MDTLLLEPISRCPDERMALKKPLKHNHPLLLFQKGGFYSPNTLQDHMASMLREWFGIDRTVAISGVAHSWSSIHPLSDTSR